MVRKGNLTVFEVAVSPKPERSRPPKLVCMHLTSIYSCINLLSRFQSIQFFYYHGLSQSMEILVIFEKKQNVQN